MPTCPGGHDTQSSDFCDVCGIRVGGQASAPAAAAGTVRAAADPPPAGVGTAVGERCPQCGADRPGQFCETCGYSFATGQGAPGQAAPDGAAPGEGAARLGESLVAGAAAADAWTAVVTADRAHFDRMVAAKGPDAGQLQFPANGPERRFRLSGPEMRIGRRSASRGLEPEIDLTGPPLDPGVSHLHAVLSAEPDGGWTVCDPGSANGTLVNDREIPPGARVRLRDGDRVCVGAWTVLTIRAG